MLIRYHVKRIKLRRISFFFSSEVVSFFAGGRVRKRDIHKSIDITMHILTFIVPVLTDTYGHKGGTDKTNISLDKGRSGHETRRSRVPLGQMRKRHGGWLDKEVLRSPNIRKHLTYLSNVPRLTGDRRTYLLKYLVPGFQGCLLPSYLER